MAQNKHTKHAEHGRYNGMTFQNVAEQTHAACSDVSRWCRIGTQKPRTPYLDFCCLEVGTSSLTTALRSVRFADATVISMMVTILYIPIIIIVIIIYIFFLMKMFLY